jgi:hypothetical protein
LSFISLLIYIFNASAENALHYGNIKTLFELLDVLQRRIRQSLILWAQNSLINVINMASFLWWNSIICRILFHFKSLDFFPFIEVHWDAILNPQSIEWTIHIPQSNTSIGLIKVTINKFEQWEAYFIYLKPSFFHHFEGMFKTIYFLFIFEFKPTFRRVVHYYSYIILLQR